MILKQVFIVNFATNNNILSFINSAINDKIKSGSELCKV